MNLCRDVRPAVRFCVCRFKGHLERLTFRHKLEVFETALGDDELDILDLTRGGVACKLSDGGDAFVLEPFLQISIERTSLSIRYCGKWPPDSGPGPWGHPEADS